MQKQEIQQLLQNQREYFSTGATLPVPFRRQQLKNLLAAVERFEKSLCEALKQDLGKSASESYMCEISMVKSEIRYMLRHVGRFSSEKRVATPLAQFVSRSFTKPSPYGCVLIMSPWNYPFLLTFDPLVDALAAGNTAILKPSAYAPHTAEVMQQLVQSCFAPEYVSVVSGGRSENESLLELPFDYIFFTGGKTVGREVMRRAARHLTPVTLELGGKSPCIVDKTANIPLAARRIVFGKFVNCGQTCVAPDYIYCDASIKDALLSELRRQIQVQYGQQPLNNPNYGKIINQKHFDRLCRLMDGQKVVCGGETNADTLQIAPTILDGITWEDAVMGEEIFGPILPVLTFDTLDTVIRAVRQHPHPLALYVFSSDSRNIAQIKAQLNFGGGCINDTLIHLATTEMGFGGVGESGMGAYHGRRGFETFTHYKSIVDKKTFLDLPMRYQPYTGWKDLLIRLFVQ